MTDNWVQGRGVRAAHAFSVKIRQIQFYVILFLLFFFTSGVVGGDRCRRASVLRCSAVSVFPVFALRSARLPHVSSVRFGKSQNFWYGNDAQASLNNNKLMSFAIKKKKENCVSVQWTVKEDKVGESEFDSRWLISILIIVKYLYLSSELSGALGQGRATFAEIKQT